MALQVSPVGDPGLAVQRQHIRAMVRHMIYQCVLSPVDMTLANAVYRVPLNLSMRANQRRLLNWRTIVENRVIDRTTATLVAPVLIAAAFDNLVATREDGLDALSQFVDLPLPVATAGPDLTPQRLSD